MGWSPSYYCLMQGLESNQPPEFFQNSGGFLQKYPDWAFATRATRTAGTFLYLADCSKNSATRDIARHLSLSSKVLKLPRLPSLNGQNYRRSIRNKFISLLRNTQFRKMWANATRKPLLSLTLLFLLRTAARTNRLLRLAPTIFKQWNWKHSMSFPRAGTECLWDTQYLVF